MNVFIEGIFIIGIVLQVMIGLLLGLPVILYCITLIRRKPAIPTYNEGSEADYAVIVTAYEEVLQIPNVVNSILAMNYSNFLIYIVADNCDISTLHFADERVVILRPEETFASNIRSHFYAIDRFKRNHERLTIIDSDNLVHSEYLNELNRYFAEGFVAVQGVRMAKNLNTGYACLDEAGDMYYRFVDRKLLFDAGSSASLAGSGMAFLTTCYEDSLRRHVYQKGAGFDKLLQYAIVNDNLRIAFAERAIVYDEKTAKSDQLIKQRARWINTWFKFTSLGVKMMVKSIVERSYNQFVFSVMLVRPPLFILLGISVTAMLANLFTVILMAVFWLLSLLAFVFIFMKSLSYFNADTRIYRALRMMPVFFFHQVLALAKAKRANELSIATKHDQQTGIYEVKNS